MMAMKKAVNFNIGSYDFFSYYTNCSSSSELSIIKE